MARRERISSGLNYYHVTQRGICKSNIFHVDSDRLYFLSILKELSSEDFKVHCFCLMDNHIHLLLETKGVNVLSSEIKRLFIKYIYYFNHLYGRDGTISKGRFWSEPINDMDYYEKCLRYILRNPIDKGVNDFLNYRWSSIDCYYSNISTFIYPEIVNSLFLNRTDFFRYLNKVEEDIDDEVCSSVLNRRRMLDYINSNYNLHNPSIINRNARLDIAKEIRELMPDINKNEICNFLQISRSTFYRHSGV